MKNVIKIVILYHYAKVVLYLSSVSLLLAFGAAALAVVAIFRMALVEHENGEW